MIKLVPFSLNDSPFIGPFSDIGGTRVVGLGITDTNIAALSTPPSGIGVRIHSLAPPSAPGRGEFNMVHAFDISGTDAVTNLIQGVQYPLSIDLASPQAQLEFTGTLPAPPYWIAGYVLVEDTP